MQAGSFRRSRKPAFAAVPVALVLLCVDANSASTSAIATATVINEFVSQPAVIYLQAPRIVSSGAIFSGRTTIDSTASAPASPSGEVAGISLVSVDATGVASFSIAGDTTSGYAVRVPVSGATSGYGRTTIQADSSAAALIVPIQALTGGGRLSIIISQAFANRAPGELSVQVNYN